MKTTKLQRLRPSEPLCLPDYQLKQHFVPACASSSAPWPAAQLNAGR